MTGWRKSTASTDGNCCVRVEITPAWVLVRGDTPTVYLEFTHDEWAAFLVGAKAGEFDLEPRP